jgi:hyperosmotically inducible protein
MISAAVVLGLGTFLAGCNPYMAAISAVSETYSVATNPRSVGTQVSDTEIVADVKAALVESPVAGTDGISVYCQQGVVVLTGVVPPGSDAGMAAVRIARATQGVARVETFFVASRPSHVDDLELEAQVKAAFVADSNLKEGQVSVAVYAGHVVLIGVVDSPEQAAQFVSDARAVDGVVSVRSYIQLSS